MIEKEKVNEHLPNRMPLKKRKRRKKPKKGEWRKLKQRTPGPIDKNGNPKTRPCRQSMWYQDEARLGINCPRCGNGWWNRNRDKRKNLKRVSCMVCNHTFVPPQFKKPHPHLSPPNKKVTPEILEQARQLRAQGLTWRQLAPLVGLHYSRIYILLNYNQPKEQTQ